jgi:acyl transferase domain-containing protein
VKIAVVGMAGVFPQARDLDTFWANVVGGVDAITGIPADRCDPALVEHVTCRRGGFLDADALDVDCAVLGIMPAAVDGAEPDQLLALRTAALALADAGIDPATDGTARPERIGVIVGRGGYLTPGLARLDARLRGEQQLLDCLRTLLPDLDSTTRDQIREAFRTQLGPFRPDTAIGLVPNLTASRIANRLDLHGPAYTVDAACASSLVAVDAACTELLSGRCDIVVAGGVHHCHDVTLWSVFSQLGALSRSGAIRPYSRHADGILVGEGTGMIVLEQLADAVRLGHSVYAVLVGSGIASDGREASPMSPRMEGQVRAVRRAYEVAHVDPATVGLVEGHGTATTAGDRVELDTLRTVFADSGAAPTPPVLGSVKSNIGHAMPAAGIAGLIKTVLAVHHGVLPPTLHADDPHPTVSETGFRLLATAEPWEPNGHGARRAGVNAFGFGGINAHVVVESVDAVRTPVRPIRTGIPQARTEHTAGGGRLAIVDPTPRKEEVARRAVERGRPWRGTHDVWFAPRGLLTGGGKVAFLCPGVEPSFHVEVDDVAESLGAPPPRAPVGCTPLEAQGRQIFAAGRLLAAALARRGIAPDHIAGHSLGEWTGMFVAEMVPDDQATSFLDGLQPGRLEVPDVAYLAAGCDAATATELLDSLAGDVVVSHDNCPHQTVVCGSLDGVEKAAKRLADAGVLTRELPFRSGFHSPAFADFLPPLQAHWERMPIGRPKVPLWSATTAEPYPDDPDAVRSLCADHLLRPVRFRELIERLYDDGVRVFVQLGTGSLTNFVDDTLKGRPHLAITAHDPRRSALAQLDRVVAALWVEGDRRVRAPETRGGAGVSGTGTIVRLSLAPPLVTLPALAVVRPLGVAASHDHLLDDVLAARRAVDAAIAHTPRRESRRVVRVGLESHPWLADHCLFRQRAGWPDAADGFPIVPITTMLDWLTDAARAAAPGRAVAAVENLRAQRWLTAAPATSTTIRAVPDGDDTVEATIEGHATARVRLGAPAETAARPAPQLPPLTHPRPPTLTAHDLYAEHWMFHGPAFQGVQAITALGDDGIDGVVEALPTPGAFLDCAGQLYGYWLMATASANFLALPLSMERVELFGPPVPVGDRAEVRVRITDLAERTIRADLEVVHRGRVAVRIRGWEDRRFDSDPALWHMLRNAERDTLATSGPGGTVVLDERWTDSSSRDLIARRYLTASELRTYIALNLHDQRLWLLGRIAAKDAARRTLWAAGHGDIFPAELTLTDHAGTLLVDGVLGRNLWVSASVAEHVAVARASLDRQVGVHVVAVGKDTALDAARRTAATEAARRATNLGELLDGAGARVARQVDGHRVVVGNRWVETTLCRSPLQTMTDRTENQPKIPEDKEYVIAWTDDHP